MDLHSKVPVHLVGSVPKTCRGWVNLQKLHVYPENLLHAFPLLLPGSSQNSSLNSSLSWLQCSWQAKLNLTVTSSEESSSGTMHQCKEWQQPRLPLAFVPRTSRDRGRAEDVPWKRQPGPRESLVTAYGCLVPSISRAAPAP